MSTRRRKYITEISVLLLKVSVKCVGRIVLRWYSCKKIILILCKSLCFVISNIRYEVAENRKV